MSLASISSAQLRVRMVTDSPEGAIQSAATVAKKLGSQGKVTKVSQARDSVVVDIQTDRPFSTVEALKQFPSIAKVFPVAPQPVKHFRSYEGLSEMRSALTEYRARYKAYYKSFRADNAEPEKVPGTGYMEAYLYNMEMRAYPNDTVDWGAYDRAVRQRDRLGAAPIGVQPLDASIGRFQATQGAWEYLGPKNLQTPYRTYFGLPPIAGRTNAVAYDPSNPLTYYAGAAGGGVWKTTDGGVNWTPLGDGFDRIGVAAIQVHPTNPNVVYVGTGDQDGGDAPGVGIMKTVDGGFTWTQLGIAEFGNAAIRGLGLDPENPDTVIAAGSFGSPKRLYRSTNGGSTWTPVTTNSEYWNDLVIGPNNGGSRIMYASASGSGKGRIYKSTDRGATWTQLTTLPLADGQDYSSVDIAVSPADGNRVYCLIGSEQKIFKSTDGGNSWTDISAGGPTDWQQAWYDYHVTVTNVGGNDVVFIGLVDLSVSFDGGTTWGSAADGLTGQARIHVDHHGATVNPNNPSELLFGSDGGVFRATLSGNTINYSQLNKNLFTTQFYHAAFSADNDSILIGGTQDNSSPASLGDLANWQNPGAGDGGYGGISQQNPAVQVTSSQFLGMYLTTNLWVNTRNISPNTNGENVPFIGEIEMDPADGNRIYAGTNYLHRYDVAGRSWSYRLGGYNFVPNGQISAIAIARSQNSRIYVGTNRGTVHMSTDNGASFRPITGTGLPNRAITDLYVSPSNPDEVVLTVSGSGSGHVFRCTNPTATQPTWVNLSGVGPDALPDISANCVTVDPTDPSTRIFVGTDVGVFATIDGGITWTNATEPLGLPNVRVNEVDIRNNKLFAGTYGRGIWKLDIGFISNVRMTIGPSPVVSGEVAIGEIRFSEDVPEATTFTLSATPAGVVEVPNEVIVAQGTASAAFPILTRGVVQLTTVTVTAVSGNITTVAQMQVRPVGLRQPLELWPGRAVGGNLAYGRVTLEGPAPVGGASVYLNSTRPDLANPQRNWVVVPEGQTQLTFRVNTNPVNSPTQVFITAHRGGVTIQNDYLLQPASISAFTATPNPVRGGTPTRATLTLDGPAPTGGAVINLTSLNPAYATVTAQVRVPAGTRTVSFNVNTLPTMAQRTVVIRAKRLNSTRDMTLTINP